MALPHSKRIFLYPARFQFGQSGAPCGGSSCCTDTVIQMIVEYYKDRTYSLSQIRKYAQAKTGFNENSCTGINHVEALNALKAMGVLHYKVVFGVGADFVYQKMQIGPVLVGVYYGSYPPIRGGNTIRGKALHYAELNGKTDFPFRGAHAVLAIGGRKHIIDGKVHHRDVYIRDPDHNSPSRPEKPPYDRIRLGDLSKAMWDLPKYTPFSQTYCIYPTRKK
jgi:hypothetical protein